MSFSSSMLKKVAALVVIATGAVANCPQAALSQKGSGQGWQPQGPPGTNGYYPHGRFRPSYGSGQPSGSGQNQSASGQSGGQAVGPTYRASRQDMPIYYATTRLNEGPPNKPVYGGVRHLDFGQGDTEYGVAMVTKPADYQALAGTSNWDTLRVLMATADNYFGNAAITDMRRDSQSDFFERIRNFHGLILIYVHGYDMPFDSAIREMAEMVQELGTRSPGMAVLPIAFSWPSPGSKAAYSGDEASLEWSERAFRTMINQIARTKAADTSVDFLAHSMGSRYAFSYAQASQGVDGDSANSNLSNNALKEIRGMAGINLGASAGQPVFRNIFLSCSDVDCHTAEERKEAIQKCVSQKVYVFVNDNDGALFTSQVLHQAPRLGRPVDPTAADKDSVLANGSQSIIGGPAATIAGATPANLFAQAESMIGQKAAALFGQKARGFVDQLTSGAQTVLTLPAHVSPEQSPEVTAWLARDPYLSREWGPKARLIDTTGFITLNMGHRLAWPLMAGLMQDSPQDAPFIFAVINKKPDSTMLRAMGGVPTYLYRYDRLDLTQLRP